MRLRASGIENFLTPEGVRRLWHAIEHYTVVLGTSHGLPMRGNVLEGMQSAVMAMQPHAAMLMEALKQ